ncbi:MAG TPA: hypothetical protein VD993_09415 [Chitinophagaceae bacterium]|nr:hypothetical protein [Chitinophagaceae bacterium]
MKHFLQAILALSLTNLVQAQTDTARLNNLSRLIDADVLSITGAYKQVPKNIRQAINTIEKKKTRFADKGKEFQTTDFIMGNLPMRGIKYITTLKDLVVITYQQGITMEVFAIFVQLSGSTIRCVTYVKIPDHQDFCDLRTLMTMHNHIDIVPHKSTCN